MAASRVAISGGPWASVATFLVARFPQQALQWPQRLARGEVLNAQGQPVAANAPCPPQGLLWYWRAPPPEPRIPFEITLLHHCSHLVVVDKPHFLPVTPGGRYLQETVLLRLQQQLGLPGLAPMHRLDLETAGVLAFIVQPGHRPAYHALFQHRQVHKQYEAVAPWRADLALPCDLAHRLAQRAGAGFMQMQVLPGEPNAETRLELIARLGTRPGDAAARLEFAPLGDTAAGHESAHESAHEATQESAQEWAHYRLSPRTGRKHQLRAQMNALGLPIAGDRIYPHLRPAPPPDAAPDYRAPLQLLARELAFTDPLTGQARRFVSQRRLVLVPGRCTSPPL